VVGPLGNTLALRLDLADDPSFCVLLERANRVVLDGYARQDLPFETLIEEINPDRNLSHAPIFQAMLVVDDVSYAASAETRTAGDVCIRRRNADTGMSQFDLTLLVSRTGADWSATIELSADLFEPATGQRMQRQLVRLIEGVVENPSVSIGRLPLIPAAERH